MSLPRFEYHEAETLEDACRLKNGYGEDARYFSGGTALMLLMRAGLLQPKALIGVRRLPGIGAMSFSGRMLRIGAAITHAQLAASCELKTQLPALSQTFNHVATPRIRNVATIGGNLANANPHQDPPVTLTALGATAVASSETGERRIPLENLFVGFFETSLEPGEILTSVEVPLPGPDAGTAFIKYLPRSADDYATVNVAVSLSRTNGRIAKARIAVGSMGPKVLCSAAAAQILVDGVPGPECFEAAAQAALAEADPELDSRGSPEYKLRIAPAVVRRAIEAAWRTSDRGAAH